MLAIWRTVLEVLPLYPPQTAASRVQDRPDTWNSPDTPTRNPSKPSTELANATSTPAKSILAVASLLWFHWIDCAHIDDVDAILDAVALLGHLHHSIHVTQVQCSVVRMFTKKPEPLQRPTLS
ncbi:hypothetical protein BKA70DRAFT_1435084 [Coprinopsis sp. MPI-PUGE-AT-0042]|nr:hypothetical protein BKA70DRAFT_1435084 [Coprinopsis sp. MPI-PUGE-AT-0042]